MSKPAGDPRPTVLDTVGPKLARPAQLRLKEGDSIADVVRATEEIRSCVPAGRGNYELEGEIARGGMGVVIKGRDTDLGRDVALKVLHDGLADDPVWLQRFVEEAQICGQLQHPGIVPVYELGLMGDERPYFTMKLIDGRTLSDLLDERKSVQDDHQRFLSVFEDICQTMAYAHDRGVIHRDLKPANVMVGPFGEVQLVDWGLAKVLRDTDLAQPGSSAPVGARQAGDSVVGTPAYMSPEQARGEVEGLDERADVFSLGAILYEILTDEPPLSRSRKAPGAEGEPLDPEKLRARLELGHASGGLTTLALECLAPEREQRPADAGEVAARIRAYLASTEDRARAAQIEAAEARVKAGEERRARRLTLGLAASLVVILVLAGGGWAWMERDRGQRRRLTEERVSAALADASFARGRSDWEQARASLELAEAHHGSGPPDPILEARLANESTLLTRAENRSRFLQDVDDLRTLVGRTDDEKLRRYAAAFARQGIELDSAADATIADEIRRSGMAVDMAAALVDWSRLRRQLENRTTDASRRLLQLALAVDDHVERSSMRRALLAEDLGEIRRIATSSASAGFSPMTTIVLSDALYAHGNVELATQLLERAEARHPDDFHLQVKLGVRRMNRSQYAEAIPFLKAAVAIQPDSSWACANLGGLCRAVGDLERALAYGRRAVEVDPQNAQAQHYLGRTLAELGELDEAIEMHRRAVELEPEYGYALMHLADLLEIRGRVPEASECYRAVLAFAPNDTSALSGLAWNLVMAGDPEQRDADEALFLTERALELQRHASHLNTLGVCFYRLDMLEDCRETLEEALRLRGHGNAYDYFVLAMATGRLGEESTARDWYAQGTKWMEENQLDAKDAQLLPRLRAEAAAVLGH